jgi:hypothetical protein
MTRFWSREIVGWVLLVLGLGIFYLCFAFLAQQLVVQALPLTVIGIFVFRGGLHLLKIAVAAQVCLEAQDRTRVQRPVVSSRQRYERPGTTRVLPGQRLPV